ncbi:hypothetical protein KUF71_007919 [Frankliniella fusca]|uniref:Uncharacterized protein n=1 Tax=Frankliniella fusca TaxID=407009 RepID=A0AAE1HC51_9NEOP|nr:hypothetical protein KUF71_007919 [Frankliniella fusca]
MTIHRTYTSIVRPILDYGLEVYDPKTKKMWQKLEAIQVEAARLTIGAMRSTPKTALLAETGEMPIRLRQKLQIQKAILKWNSITTTYLQR